MTEMDVKKLNKTMANDKSKGLEQFFVHKPNSDSINDVTSSFDISTNDKSSPSMEKSNLKSEHFKVLFENCIAKSEFKNFYTCYNCSFEVPCNRLDIIDLHLEVNPNHNIKSQTLYKVDESSENELSLLGEDMYKELVENSIVFIKKSYFCNFCKEQFNDFLEVWSHLNQHGHKTQSSLISSNSVKLSLENTPIQENTQEFSFDENFTTIQKSTGLSSNSQKNKCAQNFFQNFKDKLNAKAKKNLDVSKVDEVNNNITGETAPKELIKLIKNLKSLNYHKPSIEMQLLTKANKKLLTVQKSTELSSNSQENECAQNFFQNFKNKLNANSKKNLNASKINEVTDNIASETAPKELIKLIENLESLNSHKPNNADGVLTNCIKVNKKSKKPLLKYSREKKPQVPTMRTEKYYSRKYSLFHDKNYTEFCIEAGEKNIYNVSQEKICLMKLGVSLTFPYLSEQVCIPCGQQFLDKNQLLFDHLQSHEHIKNLTSFIAYDKEFEDYLDQYSDLKLAKWYMQEAADDLIHCYACNIKIKNHNSDILSHIETSNHISQSECWKNRSDIIIEEFLMIFSKIWYYTQRFFCEVCRQRLSNEIDFIIHLGKPPHFEKVKRSKQNGTILNFNFCFTCVTYWYGKSDYYEKHCKDDLHKRFLKNGDFMIPEMSATALDFLSDVDRNINLLVNKSNKLQLEKFKEFLLLKDIEEAVNSKFLEAKAYAFGSRISLIGLPCSTLEIFLDCNNVYCKSTSKKNSEEYFVTTKQSVENLSNIWLLLKESSQECTVPILKLKHIPTNLKCNISFDNGLGVEKSSLIGYYNMAYPTCREMILYLRKWLNLCQLAGPDCITFAIPWCVIFYLQVEGILPSVYDLIEKNNESEIVDGWECGFKKQFLVENTDSCIKHIHGFFNFYADFDYKTYVASPFLGRVIKKRTFACHHQLPEEMKLYKLSLNNPDAEILRIDSPVCLQDPIDLSQNITVALNKHQLRCFIKYCEKSADKISPQLIQ